MGGPDPLYVLVMWVHGYMEEIWGTFDDPWQAVGWCAKLNSRHNDCDFTIQTLVQEWD